MRCNLPNFIFKKIGPIKKAELELGNITIIAGRNNTGKTYLVYTLYGFLKQWYRQRNISPKIKKIVEEVTEKGHFKRTVDRETLDQERKKIIRGVTRSFSQEDLSGVFSSPSDAFEESSIEVELPVNFPKIYKLIFLSKRWPCFNPVRWNRYYRNRQKRKRTKAR